jgi:protein-L-isoaspartate(D-aspartate) O-methyltransferase
MHLEDTYTHKGMRQALVDELALKGIKDVNVLEAIRRVPRHFFMDSVFTAHAYQDKAFPIAEGQTISQPYTVARQTELLQIKKGDKVLEIGTGSGYQACVLIQLGCYLTSIEYNLKLYQSAKLLLETLGAKANLIHGDGSKGVPAYAPYQKILVTAAAPELPVALLDQLTVGGIIVIPVGNKQQQKMLRFQKVSDTEVKKQDFGNYQFVPLLGENGW